MAAVATAGEICAQFIRDNSNDNEQRQEMRSSKSYEQATQYRLRQYNKTRNRDSNHSKFPFNTHLSSGSNLKHDFRSRIQDPVQESGQESCPDPLKLLLLGEFDACACTHGFVSITVGQVELCYKKSCSIKANILRYRI